MLPKALRFPLRTVPDFFRVGRSQKGEFTLVRTTQTQEVGQAAVIVSKKLAPQATQRNAIKRKLRNALARTKPFWKNKKVVVQALKKSILTTSLDEVSAELEKLL